MGPNSTEYTEGQQGSTFTFLFTQSTALCVYTVIDWRPAQRGSPHLEKHRMVERLEKSGPNHSSVQHTKFNLKHLLESLPSFRSCRTYTVDNSYFRWVVLNLWVGTHRNGSQDEWLKGYIFLHVPSCARRHCGCQSVPFSWTWYVGNSFISFGANIHLDLRMNLSKVTVASTEHVLASTCMLIMTF